MKRKKPDRTPDRSRSYEVSGSSEAMKTRPLPLPGKAIVYRPTPRGDRLLLPALVFLVHTLIVQVTATLAWLYGTPRASSGPYEGSLGPPLPMSGGWDAIVGPLRLWDGLWYKLIAERGYEFAEANAAFWPFFPWLMRYGARSTGLPTEVVGFLLVCVALLGALVLLYDLLRMDLDDEIARRALWCLALFPTSLFLSAVYTEAIFLFLAVLALRAARRGTWIVAGLAGLAAALTRSQGVMLLLPFVVLLVQQRGWNPLRWFPAAAWAAIPALGPAIFGWRLVEAGWAWRAFIAVQSQWNRGQANPLQTFRCAIDGCILLVKDRSGTLVPRQAQGADWGWVRQLIDAPSWALVTSEAWRTRVADSDTLELVATILFLALAVVVTVKLPLWMAAFVWPPLIVPLFNPSSVHPLMSLPRFGIVLFPLFVALAMLLRWSWLRRPAAFVSVALLILLTLQFSHWYWVS